jgi:hypothetical protein
MLKYHWQNIGQLHASMIVALKAQSPSFAGIDCLGAVIWLEVELVIASVRSSSPAAITKYFLEFLISVLHEFGI